MLLNISMALFFLSSSYLLYKSPFTTPNVPPQKSSVHFNQKLISVASLGNQRMIAMLYWIETLLNSDYERYKNTKELSWMYYRFKLIAELDPKFYHNYLFGGQYLSVIKDVKKEASDLFESGLKIYPQDLKLNFFAGMHYFIECHDYPKAIEKFEVLKKTKNPFVISLLSKFYKANNDLSRSYEVLINAYQLEPKDSPNSKRYYESLYALKAEIDLNCLNKVNAAGDSNCEKSDFDGRPYLRKKGTYLAQKKWAPFKLYSPKSN